MRTVYVLRSALAAGDIVRDYADQPVTVERVASRNGFLVVIGTVTLVATGEPSRVVLPPQKDGPVLVWR